MTQMPITLISKNSISARYMTSGILAGAVLCSFVMLVYVLSDLRSWLLRTSAQLRQADLALVALMKKLTDRDKEKAVPTHFQAPLEVVNYSRRYLVSAESGNKVNLGGLVLPPPMFNDFTFEAQSAQSAGAGFAISSISATAPRTPHGWRVVTENKQTETAISAPSGSGSSLPTTGPSPPSRIMRLATPHCSPPVST